MSTSDFGRNNVPKVCLILLFCTVLIVAVLLLSSASQVASAASTYTVLDNATGGDCTAFGTWDASSKTCTLTSDMIANGITIGSNGITLDGNGHSITSITAGSGIGVLLSGRQYVTVRHMAIMNFQIGIELRSHSHYNKIENNVIRDNFWGIDLYSNSDYNTVIGNDVQGSFICMLLQFGSGFNKVIANRFSSSSDGVGIDIAYSGSTDNEFTGNTIENCRRGLYIDSVAVRNSLYRNNFVNNQYQSSIYAAFTQLSLPLPIGGNYWSDCVMSDGNGDGIADSWCNGDALPWMIKNGWYGGGEDIAAPAISAVMPAGLVATSAPVIEVNFADSPPSSGIVASYSTVTLDGVALSGCSFDATSARCSVSGINPGTHKIAGSIWDNAGHRSDITGEFTVDLSYDTTPPALTYTGVTEVRGVNAAELTASYSDADVSSSLNPASVSIVVDGGSPIACSSTGTSSGGINCALSNMTTGSHHFTISASDMAGNGASVSGDVLFVVPPLYIRANATGGDCQYVGTWDLATKTCTLTRDIDVGLNASALIPSWHGITIDGAGHSIKSIDGNPCAGVHISGKNNSVIKNLKVYGFWDSIYIYNGTGNQVVDSFMEANSSGVNVEVATGTLISGNLATGGYDGVTLNKASNNTVTDNTLSSNYRGLVFANGAINNTVYRNNLINNTNQIVYYSMPALAPNTFSLALPQGGNYWSNYNEPSEGCNDANSDGFCDTPYVFAGGQDDRPWTARNAWATGTAGKPALSLSSPSPFWASYVDYMARELSVDMTITNTGGNDAYGVKVTGITGTDGVTAATSLPLVVGDMTGGISASSICTLKYHVPAGVAVFRTGIAASAQDGAGSSYTYP